MPSIAHPAIAETHAIVDETPCSCIHTARQLGVNIPLGTNAEDIEATSTPYVGALALFKYSNGVSHVGVIIAIVEEGFYIDEGNFRRCEYTRRYIEWDDPFLVGFN